MHLLVVKQVQVKAQQGVQEVVLLARQQLVLQQLVRQQLEQVVV
jgi:hypothetical protein